MGQGQFSLSIDESSTRSTMSMMMINILLFISLCQIGFLLQCTEGHLRLHYLSPSLLRVKMIFV